MYYQYFGLTEAPFSIAVNPRYLFMSARHRDALAHLLYGVGAGGGFILLTGEVGTGKTTINRCLLEQLPQDTDIAMILNPALNAVELLASVCDEFGIDYDQERHSLKTLTDKLHLFLLYNRQAGRKTVLLIDEAQHLGFEVLEQIRLLTNLETNSQKLLQIILIGQPELSHKLAQPELRQINQRITARYNLEPLNLDETGAYIHHRMQVAGMSPDREVFPPSVVRGIHRATRGIPRVINVLCDRILLGAYGRNKMRADRAMLRTAVREVLGERAAPDYRRFWYALAAVLLVLLVPLVLWWHYGPLPPMADTAAVPAAAPSALQASAETPPSRPTPDTAPPPVVAPVPGSAPPSPPAPATIAAALLPPDTAMDYLWGYYLDGPPPDEPCPGSAWQGVACLWGEAVTWDDLSGFDRPLLLDMVTPERFGAGTLLLGIEGTQAWAQTRDGLVRLSLQDLAPLWSGRYHFLWHPPEGFTRPLARGDSSPVVAVVARRFAQLDGQEQPLAGDQFTEVLEQRVRLFQRAHGLAADGVVGVQTLLKLNEQLGIDLTAAQVRRRSGDFAMEEAQGG